MSERRDPVDAYRRAVAEGRRGKHLLEAARRCPELSVDDAMPVVLALTDHRTNNLYERTSERWLQRFSGELDPPPSEGEVELLRGALASLPSWNETSRVGAEALERLLELRGLDFARAAVAEWTKRLP